MKFSRCPLNARSSALQDESMKSLFARILAAQVLIVVLALVVLAAVSRISLNRGFIDFLERQEAAVLTGLAPALANLYEAREGWDFLRQRPDSWQRILRQARGAMTPDGPERPRHRGPEQDQDMQGLHWLRSFDRLRLRDRLFLLDERRRHLAGARPHGVVDDGLQAVVVGGEAVGWIGFAPLSAAGTLPPEAERFLRGQVRVLLISLVLASLFAVLLAYLLARYLSRPLRRLDQAVLELADGHFERRADVGGAAEIVRLASNVNHLAATLEHNRTARRRWIADIAHELRTPVAILKGEVEALTDGVREADASSLASLSQEIDQLTTLVEDLQILALADAGALDLRREVLDAAALLAEVAEPYRDRLASRRITLEVAADPPAPLMGDAGKLRRLLQNLLENCARYSMPGGRVRLAARVLAGRVELTIEDSGPGVPAHHLGHLFDRFYRVEQGRSRAGGGSGLGLAICRNIAEAHGGAIRAEASPLGGLGIVVSLPAGEAER